MSNEPRTPSSRHSSSHGAISRGSVTPSASAQAPPTPRQCLLRGTASASTLEHPHPGAAGRRTERTRHHRLGRRPGPLDRAFERLTPEHRAVFVLHHHAGRPLAEIAEIVGVPVGTVKSRLHHATRSMRAAIVADEQVERTEVRTA